MIAAAAEPHDLRLLVYAGSGIVSVTKEGTRRQLIPDAQDAAYSPDGTLVAFSRDGDLWLANSDGSGQRNLTSTPNVVEYGPSWLPNGTAVVYTANVGGRRTIRVVQLPKGPSQRIASSNAEEYGATVSRTGRIAFVSTRDGSPELFVSEPGGALPVPFDTTAPAQPLADPHDLAWSPDGTTLAYDATLQDGTTALVLDDGSTQTVVAGVSNPVYDPQGTRIAVSSATGLASIATDGTDVRELGTGKPLDWRIVPVGTPLFPNLVQRPPSELVIEHIGTHWDLGFTSMVDNRGPGALWIHATRPPGSSIMNVRQIVQLASGGVRVDPVSGGLKYVNAPPHHHWHFLGFDHYELRSASDFRLVVRDYKSGFCIADHYGTAIGVKHGPPRFLGNCAQFDPKARQVTEGASVGYTDRYPAFFHGQQLDITHVRSGTYWLVHRANEDFHLRETSYADDAASLLIRLVWRDGTPTVTTLRSCLRERC
ncbi:MAG TPA: lysyl oxidase family protein [Gaiellaceae bacterium]|nr:lysyl oxidase family protein [Gaiellaceae bacterium]